MDKSFSAKSNRKFILFFGLTITWTFLIFGFSLQPADESSALSGGIVAWLVSDILAPIFGDVPNLEHLVRKAAHFTEYFVLGVLSLSSLLQLKTDTRCCNKKYLLYALLYCVLVAFTDETIQRFVPGRSGQLSDVLLDSVGAICGGVIITFLNSLRRKHIS